ncbi:cytidine deaminase [Kordiimonas marina]|uniref:cytidine deaminase n=1 Tax=Kordiimonas marina TaxID=2872312 RepID=UPI001FF38B15|nr:cytidine deaminase [Kordiimonas marina]MCJ9427685.1 cytidine deaminase [Kordiimonas marina]
MTDTLKAMIEAALDARARAYAPYSHHPVGAAILTRGGKIYAGCNVENAAYPLGTCAEGGAISAMVMGGDTAIAHVVVIGPSDTPCTPCGGCRQKIREFSPPEGCKVTVCSKDGEVLIETDSLALLPHSFGPENVHAQKEDQSK